MNEILAQRNRQCQAEVFQQGVNLQERYTTDKKNDQQSQVWLC